MVPFIMCVITALVVGIYWNITIQQGYFFSLFLFDQFISYGPAVVRSNDFSHHHQFLVSSFFLFFWILGWRSLVNVF